MSGAMSFIDLVFMKLQLKGATTDMGAAQLATVIQQAMQNPYPPAVPIIQTIAPEALHNVPNADMIHDMLRRGFAVMKIPGDGKLKGLSDG